MTPVPERERRAGPSWGLAQLGATAGTRLMFCGGALLLLAGLGLYPLFNDDEGAFSEATRELLQSGDWLSTTLNGAPRYDKPILVYWLQAISVSAFGLNEFALRLPSALAALVWAGAIVRFAAPRLGAGAGRLAGWICLTSAGVLAIGRAATADALLNALIAGAMFDLWRHFEAAARGADGRGALRRCYLWMALGLLDKGPVAVLIPAAASLLFCLSARRGRDWLRAALDAPGWAIAAAVAGPWYAAQLWLHGRDFVDGFILRHNLQRFHGTLEGHGGSLLYYVVAAPALLLPWSALLWRGARRAATDLREPVGRYLLCWFGFVFVFFSLSGTKLPHYLLYGLTPVFILLARCALAAGSARNLLALPCLALAALFVLPGALASWVAAHPASVPPPYAAQAQRAAALADAWYFAPLAVCAAVALGACAARRAPLVLRGAVAAGAFAAALAFAVTPWLGAALAGPVKDAALVARQRPEPAVQWQISAPSFSVYRERITPARPPQPGELAITRIDRIDPQLRVERLFEEGGIALVRRDQ